ncbi:hypothetical protein CC1G_06975 [Coprinopsis cinerea okayama7|uniref:SAP domain-containing protein n=1 Tax=Coprinopsis cinerea (strain Okayama-7 / 130 / ATCC MYA-4618 / FGSC 9003) TaxID=240176 RepID=A8NZW9_COPC7|nr:hypothetical protein CC1G_06975 [Coprinopsis cinerea okayama7\|eukprot:XP_001837769.1 hypothetical protein CC1G_06975 [Coprinopsis cinerea okayama7\
MSNSTATQILFNSPALHSLKRDQLVRLCKTHSLKANGKNVDLIERLKQHALTLPKDAPLSIAVRGEDNEGEPMDQDDSNDSINSEENSVATSFSHSTRPSEQWEVVMDSIAEEEEGSSKGSLSSMRTVVNGNKAGEFGTGSSKSSTVGSSFRALATSLGLKRGTSTTSSKHSVRSALSRVTATPTNNKDELEETATPYSELPPSEPVTEVKPLAFNPARMSMTGFLAEGETPLPGHALRPGVPAPENARLSLGLGLGAPATPRRAQPTTTIRLVSHGGNEAASKSTYSYAGPATPQLKPLETTFDLIMGSPAAETNSWSAIGSIYPKLTMDDLPPASPHQPPPAATETTTTTPTPQSPEPFVFGSPLPKHRVSNAQFASAAASVLEEMNKRLQEDGVEGVDTSIIDRLHPGASNRQSLSPQEVKPLPATRNTGEHKEKFDSLHQKEFAKMEGIDGMLKRRQERAANDVQPIVGKKRKSSVMGDDGPRRPGMVGRASQTRVISNGRRAKALPGAFGMDDEEEEEEEQEAEAQPEERAGKRIRVSSNPIDNAAPAQSSTDEERARKEKERQAVKKKLEANRRRRSSVAGNRRRSSRVSGGLIQPKAKPSRFGFLSSAKSLVQSVWNRGKTTAAPAASTNIPKPNTLVKPPPASKAPLDLSKKAAAAPAKPTSATAVAAGRVPSGKAVNKPSEAKGSITSARARSPIPSFGAGSSRGSIATNNGTQGSRMSHLSAMAAAASKKTSVTGTAASRSSTANVSSVGTRTSLAQPTTAVGSMGVKKPSLAPGRASVVGSNNTNSSLAGRPSNTGSSSSRLSTSSRLFAPTASSLAKTSNRNSAAGLRPALEKKSKLSLPSAPRHTPQPQSPPALTTITNNPRPGNIRSPGTPFSPTRGKIFSTPLQMPSGIPTPVKKRVPSTESNTSKATTDTTTTTNSGGSTSGSGGATVVRQRSISGRKPRISRSKVIARLASQRAASSSSSSSNIPGTPSVLAKKPGGRPRSSLGAKVHRASLTGGIQARSRMSGGAGGDVLMSAKKKARQSEYIRRRSRGLVLSPTPAAKEGGAMEVDA